MSQIEATRTSEGTPRSRPSRDAELTPFTRVARQRGRLVPGADGDLDQVRKRDTKKVGSRPGQGAAAPMSLRAMPLVRLLWRALNEEASQHLTVDEMSILGHACMGHPPAAETTQLQIHKMRAYLACVVCEITRN